MSEHRQWHSDRGRWVYPDEAEYERGDTATDTLTLGGSRPTIYGDYAAPALASPVSLGTAIFTTAEGDS